MQKDEHRAQKHGANGGAPVHGRTLVVVSRRARTAAESAGRGAARGTTGAPGIARAIESATLAVSRPAESLYTRTAESIAARRAAASAEAACLARESPAVTMRFVAESTGPISAQTFVNPEVARCGVSTMTELISAGFTAGRRRYVRAHASAVLTSPSTTPTGMPRG